MPFCLRSFSKTPSTSASTPRVFTESLGKHAGSAKKTFGPSATSRVVCPKNADVGKTRSERNFDAYKSAFQNERTECAGLGVSY